MKLYDVKRGSIIRVLGDNKIPPDAPEIDTGQILTFLNLDGMYSRCKDVSGEICYLAAWAEVEVLNDTDK